ncbi:hypothetical protein C9374_003503 [Naegleria lovaniensis]|uniref:Protein kinase domain-containing protein n=1 Tax=Naegleria lovaniensis TaxID=51637 RepID=A0AA88KKE6_NAELO|nr:uncharacterized protein C9374_003503 [Naegleria lovaniensis]KAG2385688.1 hypothetical protein C9374_003503 [Naegleria lovaniensis]
MTTSIIQSYESLLQKLVSNRFGNDTSSSIDSVDLQLVYQDSYPTNIHVPVFADISPERNCFVFSQSILPGGKAKNYEQHLLNYVQASLRSEENLQIDGIYERICDEGLTSHLYFSTACKNVKLNKKTELLQGWSGEVFNLERVLFNKDILVSKEERLRFTVRTFLSICKALHELHSCNIIHNSILPKNVLVLSKSLQQISQAEIILQVPSFGLETIRDTLNDEHVSYFSRQAFERDNEPFSTSNDIHMLGTMILGVLFQEEVDAKMLDIDDWKNEIQNIKDRVHRSLNPGGLEGGQVDVQLEVVLKKILNVALDCLSPEEHDRPSISSVLKVFEICHDKLSDCNDEDAQLLPSRKTKTQVATKANVVAPAIIGDDSMNTRSRSDSVNSTDTSGRKSRSWKAIIKPFTNLFVKKNKKDIEEGEKKKAQYEILNRLSDGASAVVLLVTNKENNEVCVMKKYKDGAFRDYEREVECLKLFQHRNVIKMLDHYTYEEVDDAKKKIQSHVVILEYCKFGDIFTQQISFVNTKGKKVKYMRPLKYLKTCVDLLEALECVHMKGYVHSDIKPQNILISHEGVRLADFGFSVKQGQAVLGGTLRYLPPEHHEGQPSHAGIDIYSMFYSLFEILSKKKVNFQAKVSSEDDFVKIWQENLKANPYFTLFNKKGQPLSASAHYTHPLVELFEKGLEPNPSFRLCTAEALDVMRHIHRTHAAILIQKTMRGHLARKRIKCVK